MSWILGKSRAGKVGDTAKVPWPPSCNLPYSPTCRKQVGRQSPRLRHISQYSVPRPTWFPREGSQQDWEKNPTPSEPHHSIAPHQYRWLIRAFTVARLTGGRCARSSRYLETFSSSSSISGWGEKDQVRTPPVPTSPSHHWLLCNSS